MRTRPENKGTSVFSKPHLRLDLFVHTHRRRGRTSLPTEVEVLPQIEDLEGWVVSVVITGAGTLLHVSRGLWRTGWERETTCFVVERILSPRRGGTQKDFTWSLYRGLPDTSRLGEPTLSLFRDLTTIRNREERRVTGVVNPSFHQENRNFSRTFVPPRPSTKSLEESGSVKRTWTDRHGRSRVVSLSPRTETRSNNCQTIGDDSLDKDESDPSDR